MAEKSHDMPDDDLDAEDLADLVDEDLDELAEVDIDELADDDLVEADLEDLAEVDIDDLAEVDLADDELDTEDADVVEVVLDPASVAAAADEVDEEDDDDEDVEASLDEILKERLVVDEDEADDDADLVEDDRSDSVERVPPKRPDEFVCRSCFLVKHPSQLADPVRGLCRDCV